jgi:hypothetical protein
MLARLYIVVYVSQSFDDENKVRLRLYKAVSSMLFCCSGTWMAALQVPESSTLDERKNRGMKFNGWLDTATGGLVAMGEWQAGAWH